MSLESYLREIEAQKERTTKKEKELELLKNSSSKSEHSQTNDNNTKIIYIERRPRRKVSAIILLGIIIVLGFAAIKNPSQTEGKALVKSYLVDRINDYGAMLTSQDRQNPLSDGFNRLFINAIAPGIIDAFVHIKTSSYIFFSTFEAYAQNDETTKNIMSGVIIFGKIIPLSSDLDTDELNNFGVEL